MRHIQSHDPNPTHRIVEKSQGDIDQMKCMQRKLRFDIKLVTNPSSQHIMSSAVYVTKYASNMGGPNRITCIIIHFVNAIIFCCIQTAWDLKLNPI